MSCASPHFRILLIDDDIHEKRIIKRILAVVSDAPVQLDHTQRCSEGVALLNARSYDLVLLDNRLSDTISAEFSAPFIGSAFSRAPVAIISTDIDQPYLKSPDTLGVDHIVDKADLIDFLRDQLASRASSNVTDLTEQFHAPSERTTVLDHKRTAVAG